MDAGIPEMIRQIKEQDHVGLGLAEILAQIPKGDVETLILKVRGYVQRNFVMLDTEDNEALLAAIETVVVKDDNERQRYFRELFLACLDNAQ